MWFSFFITWEQRKLGDIAIEVNRTDANSNAPIMMITANDGFIEQSERYAFNNAGESLKRYIVLQKGELAYNHGASKLRPYGSCFSLINQEKARIPFVYHCFSVEKHNPEFVSIELNGNDVERQLRRIVSSGARMDGLLNISFQDYASISVLLPKKAEQDKIASAFRNLDNLTTLHQRKQNDLFLLILGKKSSSILANDWEQRKLGDILQTLPFKQFLKEPEMDGKYEVIQQGGEPIIGFANGTPCTDYKDIVIFGDHTLSLYKPKQPFFVATDGVRILKGTKNVDGFFLLFLLERYKPQSEGYKRYFNILSDIECFMSYNISEQKKIGAFFDTLDNLITLHQCKQEAFLSQKRRACFQSVEGKSTLTWEQRKLGEVAQSFEYGLNVAAKEYDGINKYLRITDIDDVSRKFDTDNLTSPDTELAAVENYRLVDGDILFARTGASVGKSYIYRVSDGLVYFAGFLIRAKIKPEYDAEFVFQNTLSESYEKYVQITSQRSGQPGVNAQEYSDYVFYLPTYDEQQKIGAFLRNLDNFITLHQRGENIYNRRQSW